MGYTIPFAQAACRLNEGDGALVVERISRFDF